VTRVNAVQHPQSFQHVNGRIGSWADWDLTPLGEEQALRIGRRIARELEGAPRALYASDLRRASRTAQILSDALDTQPVFTPLLREINLGQAVGRTKDWARENASCPLWPGTLDWPRGADDRLFAGAETKREVWNRLADFLDQAMAEGPENLVIVSHDGPLRLRYALWLGLAVEDTQTRGFSGRSGGVSILNQDAEGNRLIVCLNDLSYVQP
jgi:broad specificity phosphatase PhoE